MKISKRLPRSIRPKGHARSGILKTFAETIQTSKIQELFRNINHVPVSHTPHGLCGRSNPRPVDVLISSDLIEIFRSVFLVISKTAISKALWRKLAQSGSGASSMTFPSASFTDSKPSTFSELLQRNALRADRDIFFRPTVQPKRLLAPDPNITRFLRDILRQTLFRFQPDALGLRTEAYVDFLIFRSRRLDGFKPPGVDGKHRVVFDFVDPQSIIAHQSQRRF